MMRTRRISSRAVLIGVLSCSLALLLVESARAEKLAPLVPPRKTFNQGRRWIGQATVCTAPSGWRAEALLDLPLPGLGTPCVYTWTTSPSPPSSAQITDLFNTSGASTLVEDVPVVVPMSPTPAWSSAEVAYLSALRSAFLQQVGTAEILRSMPTRPEARIVVLDSAPTARHGSLLNGAGSRHGDTLAHLIEDIVCVTNASGRSCAAEVASELALPWLSPSVSTPDGGHSGTPVDLARAIVTATRRWEAEKLANPAQAPKRLILNLSVGWEHTPRIADCFADPNTPVELPAKAVRAALQYAAERDVIIVAAAGNDSGGPAPRTGLTCPGAYQALGQLANSNASVLTAVSGVDYSDRPLESARVEGRTGIVALAFAGVSWSGSDAPPSLVGSSVATAVVSAISALVLAVRPTWSGAAVMQAIHGGGAALSTPANACPLGFPHCVTRRANACGALTAAGAAPLCSAPPAKSWSSPSLPSEISALHASVAPAMRSASFAPLYKDPRFLLPSMQVEPWTFPMPISATCPTCYLSDAMGLAPSGPAAPSEPAGTFSPASLPDQLTIPALGRPLQIPMLLLHLDDDTWLGVELQGPLAENVAYRFNLPPLPPVRAAYLAGFDWQEQHSIFEQLFVHR